MVMANRLVACISAVCAVGVLMFTLLAGLPGRSFYAHIAEWILGDPKGGVPVVHLAFPILMAGSFASLLWKLPTLSSRTSNASQAITSTARQSSSFPTWIHRWIHRLYNVGDRNLDVRGMSLILFPSVVFVAMTMTRHMHGKELDLDEQLSITSNSFGMVSEVVGSILLIPVARQSSLLRVAGWSPARAVRLHIWAGRIFILAVLIHGGMHMFRWVGMSNERLMTMIMPPAPCWTWDEEQYTTFQPVCADEDTDCTCYAIFRNLTGLWGAVALLVLLITSLHQVRRTFYRFFYVSHIIAAPLAIILVIVHWNRSILFMAPSILYYAASSLPSFLENRLNSSNKNGVKVVAVERIPSFSKMKKGSDMMSSTHYISLTVEANVTAVQQFRPGYYVQLLAPQISSISHPFTVNIVPGKDNQLRVIFKVMGKFTSDLSQQIQRAISDQQTTSMPQLQLNGYLGTPNRLGEVLQHDMAVMVAGGIGITPYLSLLHQVHETLSQAPPNTYPTKRIVLLWTCRDASLIEYVKQEYMQPLLKAQRASTNDFKIKFLIYNTCDGMSIVPTYSDEENAVSDVLMLDSKEKELSSLGLPFTPSRFAAGLSPSLRTNIIGFLAFSGIAWAGLAATWWLYVHVQDEEHVAMRISGLLAMSIIGVVVAMSVNLLAKLSCFQSDDSLKEEKPNLAPLLSDAQQGSDAFVPSSSIEMEGLLTIEDGSQSTLGIDDTEITDTVILEERRGRPSVHEMLKYADNGRHPGLFTCGPLGLMQVLREHTEERCLLRLQQCIGGASPDIALYEEAFNM